MGHSTSNWVVHQNPKQNQISTLLLTWANGIKWPVFPIISNPMVQNVSEQLTGTWETDKSVFIMSSRILIMNSEKFADMVTVPIQHIQESFSSIPIISRRKLLGL